MADRKDIEERLRHLPPRVAAAVAARSALRILPILAARSGSETQAFGFWSVPARPHHALTIFRCCQISIFFNNLTKIDSANRAIIYATNAASAAINTAERTAAYATYAVKIADAASFATRAAAYAAATTGTAEINSCVTAAARVAATVEAHAGPADRVDAAAAFEADIEKGLRNEDASALLATPLWPSFLPNPYPRLWTRLRDDLLSLNAGFEIWIDWYQARLDSIVPNWEVERQWASLPDNVLKQSPADINAYLKRLTLEHRRTPRPDDSAKALRELPESQEPGLQFAPRDDGKIDLKPSGLVPPNDLAEIAAMRGGIIEALDDLIAVLEGSNAHGTISRVAEKYKTAISADELSIDQLYAYGVRLENARARLQREVDSGDYHDLAVATGEALDSVIALHGPVIYSTARGRELLDRARAYARRDIDFAAYKSTAQALAEAISKAKGVVAEGARDIIGQVNHDIGEGPHPDRSTEVAHTANRNLLAVAAKKLVEDITWEVVKESAKPVIIAGAKTAASALYAFFVDNLPLLREFSAVASFEISWLQCFLNWVEFQRTRLGM